MPNYFASSRVQPHSITNTLLEAREYRNYIADREREFAREAQINQAVESKDLQTLAGLDPTRANAMVNVEKFSQQRVADARKIYGQISRLVADSQSPKADAEYLFSRPDFQRIAQTLGAKDLRIDPTDTDESIRAQALREAAAYAPRQPTAAIQNYEYGQRNPGFVDYTRQGPPTSRELKSGDQIITEQYDPESRQYEQVATAPRFKETESLSTNRVVTPILEKLARGEGLSEGEQRVLDFVARANPLDRLIGQLMGGQGFTQEQQGLIQEAKQAIAQGADRNAVRERLQSLGVDPDQAGL